MKGLIFTCCVVLFISFVDVSLSQTYCAAQTQQNTTVIYTPSGKNPTKYLGYLYIDIYSGTKKEGVNEFQRKFKNIPLLEKLQTFFFQISAGIYAHYFDGLGNEFTTTLIPYNSNLSFNIYTVSFANQNCVIDGPYNLTYVKRENCFSSNSFLR